MSVRISTRTGRSFTIRTLDLGTRPDFLYNPDENENAEGPDSYRLKPITAQTQPLLEDGQEDPMAGHKTNDSWRAEDKASLHGRARYNRKVIWLGIIFVIVGVGAVLGLFSKWLITQKKVEKGIYDHSMVEIFSNPDPKCFFDYVCQPNCNFDLSREVGCCRGCPIGQLNGQKPQKGVLNCNFNVTVSWTNVTELSQRQRIWLFVSVDGIYFFQTGYGPYLQDGGNGSIVIPDGCYSFPNQQVLIVACLSALYLQDTTYLGFPAQKCNSTFGVCVSTNGVYAKSLDVCLPDGQWVGNNYITHWAGKLWSSSNSLGVSYLLLYFFVFLSTLFPKCIYN